MDWDGPVLVPRTVEEIPGGVRCEMGNVVWTCGPFPSSRPILDLGSCWRRRYRQLRDAAPVTPIMPRSSELFAGGCAMVPTDGPGPVGSLTLRFFPLA